MTRLQAPQVRELKLVFIGSGIECDGKELEGIEVVSIVSILRPIFGTVVYGGSQAGLMQRFASAFRSKGGKVVSVVPPWLEAQGLVDYKSEILRCADLAERKTLMFRDVDALLCFPGGVGTLDELFDFLGRHRMGDRAICPPIYIYNWRGFFGPLLQQLEEATSLGFIHQRRIEPLHPFESVDDLAVLIRRNHNELVS